MRAIDLVMARHWAITPDALQTIAGIAMRKNEDWEILAGKLGKPLEFARQTKVRDGVAIIPVNGPLFSKANIMTAHSGATSLEILSHDLATAVADPNIGAIILDINSPGGVALGPNELADEIRQATQTKKVIAYTGSMACSAAYWIACAASEIVANPGAVLGSIGIVTTAAYQKEPDADGNMYVDIVSSNAQNKRPDAQSEEGRAKIQAELDVIENEFIDAVAKFRGIPRADVIKDFGGGGVLIAADAVKVGMADRLGSLENVLSELANRSRSTQPTGARTMTAKKKEDAAAAQAAAGVAENPATGGNADTQEAVVVDEKARVAAILKHPEAKGREDLAQTLALETDLTPEAAGKVLASAAKAEAKAENPLDKAMRQQKTPQVAAGGGADAGAENPTITDMARRFAKK